jgi:hypothetical protein
MPWSIENETASRVLHARYAESPLVILFGSAVSVHAGGGGVTVMVAEQCTDCPPFAVAVPVYVVVTLGVTFVEPLSIGRTDPTP